jgi:hypothetical protein
MINQMPDIFSEAKNKTDWFLKVFVSVIVLIVCLVVVSIGVNQIISGNVGDGTPLGQETIALLTIFPLVLAIGAIYAIWRADILEL